MALKTWRRIGNCLSLAYDKETSQTVWTSCNKDKALAKRSHIPCDSS